MDEPTVDIIIEVSKADASAILALAALHIPEAAMIESAGSLGGGDLVAILVPIAVVSVPAFLRLMGEIYKTKNSASIEVAGAKVTGLPQDAVEDILRQHLRHKRRHPGEQDPA